MLLTFIILTFLATTCLYGFLLWLALRRVVRHVQGNAEAARVVTEHILVPLLGRKDSGESPEPQEGAEDPRRPKRSDAGSQRP